MKFKKKLKLIYSFHKFISDKKMYKIYWREKRTYEFGKRVMILIFLKVKVSKSSTPNLSATTIK